MESSSPAAVLQALLQSATRDLDARNQALALLRGAPLWVCPWPTDPSRLCTVKNMDGVPGIPVFTDEQQLAQAAITFGWLGPDGAPARKQVPIAETVRYAYSAGLFLLVVDPMDEHAMELDAGDMELLAAKSASSRKPASTRGLTPARPFPSTLPPSGRGAGHVTQAPANPRQSRPQMVSMPPGTVTGSDGKVVARFGGSKGVALDALLEPPDEELTQALAEPLKAFPEVEWACVLLARREGPGDAVPAVGIRVNETFRNHLNEIISSLREAASSHGATLDILVLDDPSMIRLARRVGTLFYPWKR